MHLTLGNRCVPAIGYYMHQDIMEIFPCAQVKKCKQVVNMAVYSLGLQKACNMQLSSPVSAVFYGT